MDVPVSDSLRTLLARQDMRGNGLAGPALHEMGAGCANEGEAHPATALRKGGDRAPMGMEKSRDRSPGQVFGDGNKQPSPANRPVALRLVASNTLSATSKPVELNLVLIRGGLE